MPKYGLLTYPARNTAGEIREFARLGFDYAEISIEEPYATPQILVKDREKILQVLKKNRMFAIGHTSYWDDFGTSHEKVRQGWIEEGKDMIRAASALNMELLNFHFWNGNGQGKKFPDARRIFLSNFADSMKVLSRFGKRHGVALMLENMTPHNPKTSYMLDDFEFVVKSVPSLMVHLDVAHAFVEGGNRKIDEYVRRFSKRIVHIHAHDNNGEEDEHLPLGQGRINFKKVIASLKRIDYDRTVTFEVFPSNNDALKSKKKFERMWNSS